LTDYDPARIAASYDAVAETYADKLFNELDYKPFDRELLDQVAERADGVICDLGCGPGHVARYLAGRGAEVIGVDLSHAMVDVARRRNPGLRFEHGNMLDLPFADGEWAAVVALYSIIHIEREQVPAALAETRRVLRRDGLLIVGVHGGDGEIRHDQFLGHDVPFTGTFFRLDELRRFIEDAGFTIERAVERAPYEQEGQTPRLYVVAS
jgi:SAM-dependent methyltransferase